MLPNINLRMIIQEADYEASLFTMNLCKKGLIYLWAKFLGTHLAMLLDIGVKTP